MKTKIIVIGSNSFSGSDFIDLLLEDQNMSVIGISRSAEKSALFLPYKRYDNPLFRFYQLDLNKDIEQIFDIISNFNPDYIVNFAAQSEVAPSWKNPAQWFQTNVVSLTELVSKLRVLPDLKKYIHISSPEVYGTCHGALTENSPLNPSTPYAASKAAGDMSLMTFYKQYNFPLVLIRSTNVYGAHQQLFKIIPRSIIYIKSGKTIQLHGGGNAIKSYIHIRDISRGELAALKYAKIGQTYHLSPDMGICIKDLVKLICEKLEVRFDTATESVDERPGQDAAYVIDSSKAKLEFGWQPKISINSGINDVIMWINKNWPLIQNEPQEYIHKA